MLESPSSLGPRFGGDSGGRLSTTDSTPVVPQYYSTKIVGKYTEEWEVVGDCTCLFFPKLP